MRGQHPEAKVVLWGQDWLSIQTNQYWPHWKNLKHATDARKSRLWPQRSKFAYKAWRFKVKNSLLVQGVKKIPFCFWIFKYGSRCQIFWKTVSWGCKKINATLAVRLKFTHDLKYYNIYSYHALKIQSNLKHSHLFSEYLTIFQSLKKLKQTNAV